MIVIIGLFLGLIALMILGFPMVFAIAIPSFLATLYLGVPPVSLITMMFSGVDSFALMAIPFFILAGNLMEEAGITKRIVDFANIVVGRMPGGLGQVNIAGSMVLSGISGSGVSDAAAIGSLTIPPMLRQGYHKDFAVCVTACAASMGPIIPPSIAMILSCYYTNVSVGAMFVGGAVPGVLIGLGLMALTYYVSVRRGYVFKSAPPSFADVILATRRASIALMMPFVIIGGIISGVFTATESGVIAVVYALTYGLLISRTISIRRLAPILLEAAVLTSVVLFIVACSTIFGNVLSRVGFQSFVVGSFALIDHDVMRILAIMAVLLLLGLFIDPVVLILMFAVPLAAVGAEMGYHPIHFGVWFIIVTLYGAVTPPVGTILYVAMSIANAKVDEVVGLLVPYMSVLILVAILVLFIPELTLWLPRFVGLL